MVAVEVERASCDAAAACGAPSISQGSPLPLALPLPTSDPSAASGLSGLLAELSELLSELLLLDVELLLSLSARGRVPVAKACGAAGTTAGDSGAGVSPNSSSKASSNAKSVTEVTPVHRGGDACLGGPRRRIHKETTDFFAYFVRKVRADIRDTVNSTRRRVFDSM